MRLSQYLEKKKLSPVEFSLEIGVTRTAVIRYCAGTRIPEPETMNKIIDVTDGKVTANDFYEHRKARQEAEPTN